MKIVVAGEGVMALRIVDALMHRHQVVCLCPQESPHFRSDHLNAEILVGPITSPIVLAGAGAKDCNAFVACSTSDEQNIVACMAAHRLGAKRTICVVNGQSFLTTDAEGKEMADGLGIGTIIRPIEQLANELITIVRVPGALEIEAIADGRLVLFRYAVEEGSKIEGQSLSDLALPKGTRLVHVRRGDEFLVPRGDSVLQRGDKVIAMGEQLGCTRLGSLLCGQQKKKKDAAVIGGGRVGRAVTQGLIKAGFRVTLIDNNLERCERAAAQTEGLVLHGDGTDVSFLEQEDIAGRRVVIAVTDSDEKNLLVSLVMKQLGNPRVVTRADSLSNEKLFEKVGVDVVRSAKGAAIRTILRAIDEGESEMLAELEHGATYVQEITIDAGATEISMTDLSPPAYAVVGAILRGSETIIPGGLDSLKPSDHLFVFGSRQDQEAIHDYFKNPHPVTKD